MLCFIGTQLIADNGSENFCFNADVPEAQMDFSAMCLTAPILICPPTYLGCPSDNIDPSNVGFPTASPGDANCPEPVVSYEDAIVTNTPCLKVIHRTWTATYPPNGASLKLFSTCQQVLYMEDTEAPVIANCPTDMTIDLSVNCDSTAIWGVPTASDNCDLLFIMTTHFSGEEFSSGTTTVTYTAQDLCGFQTVCSFNVSVIGSCCTMPDITCPADITVCPGNTAPSITGFANAVPSDPSCGAPVITHNDIVLSSGPCTGETTIQRTWTATDASDNTQSVSCTQLITAVDNTAPSIINLPSDINVNGTGPNCTVAVNWFQPIATDNCGTASVTSNFTSGTSFTQGTTVVTYTATDNCGNTATGSFNVTIDCQCSAVPILNCPADYVSCPTGSYPDPSLTGTAIGLPGDSSCASPTVTYNDVVLSTGPCNGGYEIIRTWTAMDPSNASLNVSCTQNISLSDNEAPLIADMPTDITLFKKGTHCSMPVIWSEPTITDDCTLAVASPSVANGSDFTGGTTTVIYTATDICGNTVTDSFNVTIECNTCNTPPSLVCPPDYETCVGGFIPDPSVSGTATATSAGGTCGQAILYHSDAIVAFGNCPGGFVIHRTWTAFDSYNAALITTCVQVISINDASAPTFTNVPTDIVLNGTGSNCSAFANWTAPTANDNCGVSSVVSSHNSGTSFNEGTTTVTYTATDNCNNTSTVSFNVIVTCGAAACTTPPVISCPPNYTACAGSSSDPIVTGFASATISGTNCTGTASVTYTDNVTNNSSCTGGVTIQRTWLATNPNNTSLTATCIQTITLTDVINPVITGLPQDIFLSGTGSSCFMIANWNEPTATDNCGLASFSANIINGSTFAAGTTTVIYTAVDNCGNTVSASFNVTVTCASCATPPVISCPSNYTACIGSSSDPIITGSASATISGPNCSGTAVVTYSDNVINDASCNGGVTIERTWKATNPNNANLTATCLQIITLTDNVNPVISGLPQDLFLSGMGSSCFVAANWSEPTATDNCGLASFSSNIINGSTFGQGTTTVMYTAIDNCGNSVTESFNVTVTCAACATPPVISCPPNYTSCPGFSNSPSVTGYATATINGANCSGQAQIDYTDLIVSTGPCNLSKTIERTWTATNPNNAALVSSCTQIIYLVDNSDPIITGTPQDIYVTGSGAWCAVAVNWVEPSATDNCGLSSFTSSHNNGDSFIEGTTVVVYTAVDNCGNTSTVSFNVNVGCAACSTPPSISCPPDYSSCPSSSSHPSVTGFATAVLNGPNCSGTPIITYSDINPTTSVCENSAIITRTWVATHPNDPTLVSTCNQIIYLIDDSFPVITNLPQDITVSNTGENCQAIATWVNPDITDNCGLSFAEPNVLSGSLFDEGISSVTYTATDICGNTTTASFTVTVICATCATPPIISCPADYTSCPSLNAPSPMVSGQATAVPGSAFCATPIVAYTDFVQSTGGCSGAQVIERIWTATDPNNVEINSSCTQYIILEDTQAPVITACPSNLFLIGGPLTGSGSGSGSTSVPLTCAAVAVWDIPAVSDNCSNVSIVATNEEGIVVTNGSVFEEGVSIVVYTATDGCGNTSTCSFEVEVSCDAGGGEIVCPNDIVVECTGSAGAYVNWPQPSYSGSCGTCDGGEDIAGFMYMGELNGNYYYCSLEPASWGDASDICAQNGGYLACIGSQEENEFLASILAIQSAWIGLSDAANEGEYVWSCGEPFNYTNWYPGQPNNFNASQDCIEMMNNGQWNDQYCHYLLEFIMEKPCSFVNQVGGPSPGSYLTGGTYTVTYEVNDACGSNEQCSFDIIVEDGLTIECPDNIVTSAPSGSAGVQVSWNPPVVNSCCSDCSMSGGNISGFTFMGSFGGHHYYCSTEPDTWTDAQANCIANGGNLAIINNASENTFLANILTQQSAWIGCSDSAVEGTFEWVDGSSLSYTNWYPGQPNDFNNNQDYVEMLNNGQWNDQYNHYALEYIMEISDCLNVTQTSGPAPGSVLAPGSSHVVSYTATDGCGNSESCSFTIEVESISTVCDPGGNDSSCSYIESIQINDMDNISGDNGGYADFANNCINLHPGSTIPIEFSPGFGTCPTQVVYWTFWIDINADGDYDDVNEFVAYGNGSGIMAGLVTVPNGLQIGQTTARVMMKTGSYAQDPCENFTNGEVEDYCVIVSATLVENENEEEENEVGVLLSKESSSSLVVDSSKADEKLGKRSNEALELDYTVKVYPNPVSEYMTIEIAEMESIQSVTLCNLSGQKILNLNDVLREDNIKVNVGHLSSGMYILNIAFQNGHKESKKVIIQN